MEPSEHDNIDTGLGVSIWASRKLHRVASGGWWIMMNLQDSSWNHHPTTTRGFLETVNWNLKLPVFDKYYFAILHNGARNKRVIVRKQ